jgi:hypothetical protein
VFPFDHRCRHEPQELFLPAIQEPFDYLETGCELKELSITVTPLDATITDADFSLCDVVTSRVPFPIIEIAGAEE